MLAALCEQLGWYPAAQRSAAQKCVQSSQHAVTTTCRSSSWRPEAPSRHRYQVSCKARCRLVRRGIVVAHAADDQAATPLLDAVIDVAERVDEVSLHIPGHKRGAGALPRLQRAFGAHVFRHDVTELPGLDYLSSPTGAIAEAQRLAADAFGADCTWFLVNGTTAGIQAAVLATCGPGDTLIAARNCHLSVVSAMVLSGCRPQWVQPRVLTGWDIATDVTPVALEAAFARAAYAGRPAKAALVVSPSYFGTTSDVPGLAAVCHRHNALLILDEAHGAHCSFDDRFPPAALASGWDGEHADIVVQSTHKMLAALGQSSMLHIRGERALQLSDRISRALQVLQSSSPSYLLMASLDAARAAAAAPGAFDEALAAAAAARDAAAQMSGLQVLSAAGRGIDDRPILDPLKLTLGVAGLGISGYQAADWLTEHGIATELATSSLVLAAFGAGSAMADAERLIAALKGLCRQHQATSAQPAQRLPAADQAVQSRSELPAMELRPREVHFAATERVQWDAAAGRICAELLCPYPPGIPAVVPGEVLTEAVLACLRQVLQEGGTVTGAADAELNWVDVVKRDSSETSRLFVGS